MKRKTAILFVGAFASAVLPACGGNKGSNRSKPMKSAGVEDRKERQNSESEGTKQEEDSPT